METLVRSKQGTDRARQRRRLPLLLVAMVILSALAGGWIWWHDSPSAFGGLGNGYTGPTQVGEAFHVGDVQPTHTVEVLHIDAVLSEGSAAAAVSVHICVRADESTLGSARGDVGSFCSDLRPVEHARVAASLEDEYVIATIVPLEEGAVVVEGFRITYRDGLRTFTDHAGPTIEITATD